MIRIYRQHYRRFDLLGFFSVFSVFIGRSSAAFSVCTTNGADKTARMSFYFTSNLHLYIHGSTSIRSSTRCSRSRIHNYYQDITWGKESIQFENLMEMDVVTFVRKKNNCQTQRMVVAGEAKLNNDTTEILELGAIHGGLLVPLCAWTTESVYASTAATDATIIEFLQDDHAAIPQQDQVTLHALLPAEAISYGSRQVGGGKGPQNPHGEESELLYYVDKQTLDDLGVHIVIRPELEILW
jgi:hypothetical protein